MGGGSSYFCRLEKRRQERNSIKALNIQGQAVTDAALITKEVLSFYSQLCSSSFSNENCLAFFSHIHNLIPCIDFAKQCDADITINELDKAVECLSLNKSPGCDGLTSDFYKHFWNLLREPLFYMVKEATENMVFPPTMKQGVISLIPKPGKDPKVLDNLRPITLLNTDYKILALIYTNRLKINLHKIISDSQSGFM